MAKDRLIGLEFPLSGVNKRLAYQKQPPYTTPDALNVRPIALAEERARGGSRPGFGKASHVMSTDPVTNVNLLTRVRYNEPSGLQKWADLFQDDLHDDVWKTFAANPLPSICDDEFAEADGGTRGGCRVAFSDFDYDERYRINLFIAPYQGQHRGNYYLYALLNDTTPLVGQDSLLVKLDLGADTATGKFAGSYQMHKGGVDVGSDTKAETTYGGIDDAGRFQLIIRPGAGANGQWSAYWRNLTIFADVDLPAGMIRSDYTRIAFAMANDDGATGPCLADDIMIEYHKEGVVALRDRTVAAAAGRIYVEDEAGRLTYLTGTYASPAVTYEQLVQGADLRGTLYLTNPQGFKFITGPYGGIGVPIVCQNDAAHNPTYPNFVQTRRLTTEEVAAIMVDTDYLYLEFTVVGCDNDEEVSGGFLIREVDNTETTITSPSQDCCRIYVEYSGTWGVNALADCLAWRPRAMVPVAYPVVFDPVADDVSTMPATQGYVPLNCHLIAVYRGRLVFANKYGYYMSRSGNATNWDYFPATEDEERAVAGTLFFGGSIEDELTALIPGENDYLVLGGRHSLWLLRGELTSGGVLDNLSRTVGCVGPQSWCHVGDGSVIVLAPQGLFQLPAQAVLSERAVGHPKPISRDRLPRELIGLSADTHDALLSYDQRENGVWIFVTPRDGSTGKHYWLDLNTNSIWRVSVPDGLHATSILSRSPGPGEYDGVLVGCRDAYVRSPHRLYHADDGTTITSYVLYGPIRLGNGYQEGMLLELIGTIGADSGGVKWSLLAGDTAEEAAKASAAVTGTWSAGRNYTDRPRRRAGAFVLKLEDNDDNRPWMIEELVARTRLLGVQRKS